MVIHLLFLRIQNGSNKLRSGCVGCFELSGERLFNEIWGTVHGPDRSWHLCATIPVHGSLHGHRSDKSTATRTAFALARKFVENSIMNENKCWDARKRLGMTCGPSGNLERFPAKLVILLKNFENF